MRDSLEHRGPDDFGVFIENNIGFDDHRRLSILLMFQLPDINPFFRIMEDM
jgi:asparagine synthetase B (glutamine-hydrolysing)